MARNKNALRGHFIAEYTGAETEPTEWLELAKYIETVDPDINENVEEVGFYDGDGTEESDVISVKIGYNFSGHYDEADAAQALVASKEFAIGEERKVWHKRVSADGTKEHTGRATLSNVVVGGGDAVDYEAFECTITWDEKPTESPVAG